MSRKEIKSKDINFFIEQNLSKNLSSHLLKLKGNKVKELIEKTKELIEKKIISTKSNQNLR